MGCSGDPAPHSHTHTHTPHHHRHRRHPHDPCKTPHPGHSRTMQAQSLCIVMYNQRRPRGPGIPQHPQLPRPAHPRTLVHTVLVQQPVQLRVEAAAARQEEAGAGQGWGGAGGWGRRHLGRSTEGVTRHACKVCNALANPTAEARSHSSKPKSRGPLTACTSSPRPPPSGRRPGPSHGAPPSHVPTS